MTSLHGKVLRLNRTFLLENLCLCELLYSGLHENNILTDTMLEEIQVGGSTEYYRFLHYRFCATRSLCNSLVTCQRYQLFFHQISLPTLTRIVQCHTISETILIFHFIGTVYFITHLHVLLKSYAFVQQAIATVRGRITKMLTMLTKRGPKAFDTFIKVLLNTSQPHVAKKLRVTEGMEWKSIN